MNRKDFFSKQKVTQSELDQAFFYVDNAINEDRFDANISGVITGLVPTLGAGASINVTKGVAIDQLGHRVLAYSDGTSTKNHLVSTNTAGVATAVTGGQERWLAIYAHYGHLALDPRVDGNGVTVYFDQLENLHDGTAGPGGFGFGGTGVDRFLIESGTSAPTGTATRPTLRTDAILVCDVLRTPSDAANVVDTTRRQIFGIADTAAPGAGNGLAVVMSAFSTWLGGRTNPAQASLHAQIDKIITDLGLTLGSDDGAERIGAQGSGSLTSGSVRSQLDTLDTRSHMTGAVSWLGGRSFSATDIVQTIVATLIGDLGAVTASDDGAERIGAEATGTLASGSVRSQLNTLEANKGNTQTTNTWIDTQTHTAAAVTTPTIEFGGTVSDSDYRLLWQTTVSGSTTTAKPAIRLYYRGGATTGNTRSGSLVITINAAWSGGAAGHWTADFAGSALGRKAVLLSLGETQASDILGVMIRFKDNTTSTWTDSGWDSFLTIANTLGQAGNQSPVIHFGNQPSSGAGAQVYVLNDVPKITLSTGVVKTFTIV